MEQQLRRSSTATSPTAGGLTIFDNTGLVVPELDADGLPPPGTRLRKGMALYVMCLQDNCVSAHNVADTGRWTSYRGSRGSLRSSTRRRPR